MRPPPAGPEASSDAPASTSTRSPVSCTVPPRSPDAAPVASTAAATRVMPCGPPSITMRPSRCPIERARTMPSRFSTVSTKPLRATARSSMLPPSARTRPSWSSRASRPSLRALKRIRPSPSTSTVTALAATRPIRAAVIEPLWVITGAASTTVPPGALMMPALTIAPAVASRADRSRRPRCSPAADGSSVLATSAPTSSREPAPNTMPRGLTRKTVPSACSEPRISDGSPPVTRLSSTEVAAGWLMRTASPAPIEKPRQSTVARSPLCTMSIEPGAAPAFTATCPCTTEAPSGSARAAPAAAEQADGEMQRMQPEPRRRSAPAPSTGGEGAAAGGEAGSHDRSGRQEGSADGRSGRVERRSAALGVQSSDQLNCRYSRRLRGSLCCSPTTGRARLARSAKRSARTQAALTPTPA